MQMFFFDHFKGKNYSSFGYGTEFHN